MRFLVALVFVAQAVTPPQPAFEVASVKIANPDILQHQGFGCGVLPQGRFKGLGNLRWLVACAYTIPAARSTQEIVGLPKWADDDLFEIQAIAPSGLTNERGLAMLRSLLADRFQLVAHREQKEVQGYILVVARKDGKLGPHLQPTPNACADWLANGRPGDQPMVFGDLPCGRGEMRGSIMRQSRVPLAQLANFLSPRVERPVDDRTGLTGMYAFDLRWAPETGSSSSDGLPPAPPLDNLPTSIFTALQEQLGLKLEPTKTMADRLIIDHVEKPAPN